MEKLNSHEVEGRKISISKNSRKKSTFQTTADCNILKQNILFHSYTIFGNVKIDLSTDVYIGIYLILVPQARICQSKKINFVPKHLKPQKSLNLNLSLAIGWQSKGYLKDKRIPCHHCHTAQPALNLRL